MKCKTCINYDVCNKHSANCDRGSDYCKMYKDRSKIIELPCKVGDVVYSYCEELYRILPYFIDQIIISYDSDSLNNEYVTFDGISSNASELLADMDFTVDEIGKTVFLTREEAETALKKLNVEREKNG